MKGAPQRLMLPPRRFSSQHPDGLHEVAYLALFEGDGREVHSEQRSQLPSWGLVLRVQERRTTCRQHLR
eukprot:jgi/Tetstr1/424334/TSEL_014900.t1